MNGGDLGAPRHRGYQWWMVDDAPDRTPLLTLPPGIVFGLKHSVNQATADITVFGRDPCAGPSSVPGLQRQLGGDLGTPSGQGFCWYESSESGQVDWNLIDLLPRWTVVGLKHSISQRNKKLVWHGGKCCDACARGRTFYTDR
jgi:hypothetical protein